MNYLFIAVFSPLIGKLLNIFASEEAQQGSVASYSPEAYQLLFTILLIPTVISV